MIVSLTLGGHSLLATQVVSKLRETFGVDLPLRFLFDAPTVAGLAERIETARRSEQGLTAPPMERVSRDGDLPLSFAQQRLWFLDQLMPGSIAYNMSGAVRLTGPLNVVALEQSLTEVLRRHEILRTTFRAVDGQPFQSIAPAKPFILPVTDLEPLPEAEREAEARRLAIEEAHRLFDLARGPLFRATLLRLGEEDHILQCAMHHAVSDGWSIAIFNKEIGLLYHSFSTGQPLLLPELPIQYADFAHWQRQWLQGEVLEAQLSYWRKQLAGAPPSLELPTDRARPAVQTFHGARQSLVLPKSLTEALKGLSRQEGVTLFMTLLAAFKVLLSRYTGQEDIVVGTPIAGRNRAEIEPLIGFFINTVALRTDLSGGPSFRELLRRVREVALGAYDHQEMPFEKLVEELQPERDLSRTPLFQVFFNMLNLESLESHRPELNGLTAEQLVLNDSVKFDLSLTIREETEGVGASLQYNTDLFDDATIDRMICHFQTMLEGIVANPDQSLSDLPILTKAERHQLLAEWNETKRDFPKDKCLHQLFEEQVERTPDGVALVFEDQHLTYRELNTRANQLAHYLRKLGVGPETLVGICMERSVEMVVGLLGILKAGGAYVPLDPEYPKERLDFVIEDTRLAVLLTRQREQEELGRNGAKVVCIDAEFEVIARQEKSNPAGEVSAESPAYAIYTSGSTGKPKGVIGLHRGIINRLYWMWERYPFESKEVFCQKTSLNFVDSVAEIFGPLLKGLRLVLIPDECVRDPGKLVEMLAMIQTTRIVLVPSLLRAVLEVSSNRRHSLTTLRYWFVSGEPLPSDLVKRFREELPDAKLINLYGCSEASADSTQCDINECGSIHRILIGRPINNTQTYILDAVLQPVPIGVPGELYIGGAGLARGYLNRAALTAEKFLPNPFSEEPGASLYKTGDLARYLADANIEFLGRIDHQVKIRGFRVEPEEIEAVLGQHLAVKQAVVMAREGLEVAEGGSEDRKFKASTEPSRRIHNSKSLVAYVIPTPEQTPTVSELRGFVRKKLPEYMVPSSFVFLEALPRTPNGKVDRKALPAPDQSRPDLEARYVAPRSAAEARVAKIWAEALKLERVGVRDNFFDLGGHSLLATQVISRVREAFSVNLPLRLLFEGPTVEELVLAIEETLIEEMESEVELKTQPA